jgi:hypothetical protein
VTGPTLEDPSWVEDPGAGVVEAGVSWRSAALAALMKSKSVNTQVERSKCHYATRGKLTVWTSF